MPRVRRRAIARRDSFDSPRVRSYLVGGQDWGFLDGPELNEDELREAWLELRDELLTAWFTGVLIEDTWQERGEPGTRPWGWWKFDAPEPRRMLEHSFEWDDTLTGERRKLVQEAPESERDYLERHGLLTDAERDALATMGATE